MFMGGRRAGTSQGGTVWVRFLVTVRQVFGCNWSRLVLSIHQRLENGIFPQAGGDLRAGGQGLGGLQLQLGEGGGLEVVQGTFPRHGLVSSAQFLCEGPQ